MSDFYQQNYREYHEKTFRIDRSLMDAFGGGDFARLRMGVGRSGTEMSVADYVLSKFSADENRILEQFIARARDAVVTILCNGTKDGMNRFNSKI